MRYFVTHAGETRPVDTGEGERPDEPVAPVELATVPGTRRRHLLVGDRGTALMAHEIEGGWVVELHGRIYRLEVEDERTHAIRALTPAAAPRALRELRAPMAGLVLRIEVTPGQRVETGTGLVVIEAMKMENELRAEAEGVVETIDVTEGDAVNPDDLLLTFAEGAE